MSFSHCIGNPIHLDLDFLAFTLLPLDFLLVDLILLYPFSLIAIEFTSHIPRGTFFFLLGRWADRSVHHGRSLWQGKINCTLDFSPARESALFPFPRLR